MDKQELANTIKAILQKRSSSIDSFGHPEITLDESQFDDCARAIVDVLTVIAQNEEWARKSVIVDNNNRDHLEQILIRRVPAYLTQVDISHVSTRTEGSRPGGMATVTLLVPMSEVVARDLARMLQGSGRDLNISLVSTPQHLDAQSSPSPDDPSRSTDTSDSMLGPLLHRSEPEPRRSGSRRDEMIRQDSFFVDNPAFDHDSI